MATSQVMTKPMASDDLLGLLDRDTAASLARVEARNKVNVDEQLSKLGQEMEQTLQIKDENQRNIRMEVLKANFETLHAEVDQEGKDLATAIMGISTLMTQMGHGYEDVVPA